jgi:hypothetical protein
MVRWAFALQIVRPSSASFLALDFALDVRDAS